MKLKTLLPCVLAIISGIVLVAIPFIVQPEYMVEKDRTCIVLDRLQTSAGYKVQGKFILVLRDANTNKAFDIDVTPTTYSLARIGTTLHFDLSDNDMGMYNEQKQFHAFAFLISVVVGIILIIIGINCLPWKD